MNRASSKPPLILIVDDEPTMLRYLRTLLEVEGYRVETATNGAEAMQRLQQAPTPELLLLDVL
ncbi:MAG TPA: response regulator, partial [Terriglobales bacterium]|nr:response regulator [Terriglobales bacterium]